MLPLKHIISCSCKCNWFGYPVKQHRSIRLDKINALIINQSHLCKSRAKSLENIPVGIIHGHTWNILETHRVFKYCDNSCHWLVCILFIPQVHIKEWGFPIDNHEVGKRIIGVLELSCIRSTWWGFFGLFSLWRRGISRDYFLIALEWG